MPYIGCHVSIADGVEQAPTRGAQLGCKAIQLFTTNQMQWKGQPISDAQAQQFRMEVQNHRLSRVIAHDGYLINLASPEPAKLALSRRAFIAEIERCELLQIRHLVLHPGAHMGKGVDYGLRRVAESLDYVIEKTLGAQVSCLLETTAGQGSNLGASFEQLRAIIDYCSYPERLGICLDTCHVFAAGYDLVEEPAYEETLRRFADILGLDRLQCVHLNDSQRECGSRIDRHANLGTGRLGWPVFLRIVKDPRFAELPLILETPGGDDNMAREIKRLQTCCRRHARRAELAD